MRKTVYTMGLICCSMQNEHGAKCGDKYVHGDILGHAAVVIVPILFPDGSRYLLQLTKLVAQNELDQLNPCNNE